MPARYRRVPGRNAAVMGADDPPNQEDTMLVHELMTSPPVTAPPSLPLPDAAHLMRSRGIRRLPVVDGTTLVGIVTYRDLREALPSRVSTLSPWEATTRLAAVSVADVMR